MSSMIITSSALSFDLAIYLTCCHRFSVAYSCADKDIVLVYVTADKPVSIAAPKVVNK